MNSVAFTYRSGIRSASRFGQEFSCEFHRLVGHTIVAVQPSKEKNAI